MTPDPTPAPAGAGLLVVAATPIGDVTDASARLVRELRDADMILAEDTRRIRRLAASLGVDLSARLVSYFEGNERSRTPDAVAAVAAGQRVLLVTDAGTPGISDPGYRLVSAVLAAGLPVTAAPGPSAVHTALVLSGLPVDRYCFEGFPPRKAAERARRLAELAAEPRTMVFFEAPHRLAATLAAMGEAFGGDRAAAVCRELTKTYEEVRRGSLAQLFAWAADGVRGEVTLVVAGAGAADRPARAPAEIAALVLAAERAGAPRKEAIASVARDLGVPKRVVYAAAVEAKHGQAVPPASLASDPPSSPAVPSVPTPPTAPTPPSVPSVR